MGAAEEKITEAELEVMEVLWAAGEPVTLGRIREVLADRNGETVKTLLRRLCAKGAAAQEKRQVYYYRPLVSRAELGCYRTRKLIDKLYAGSARQMVAALVEHDQLSGEDIAELRALLDGLGREEAR
ncbi:BlaI/MecI/CopY family transcriptional regulator [Flavonifractor porci]|uniref:BlaI/MecI/CopY family transcriptional regulator n=1 Tax=Flavonifractor porci TaxID=3133422 RepID=UPI0030B10416